MELKFLPRWPKIVAEAPVRLEHFTPQQRIWLRKWHRVGGKAWVLLQVNQEFLLFKGEAAAEFLGKVCRADLYAIAHRTWTHLDEHELRECVS